jgi:hypothetical protein
MVLMPNKRKPYTFYDIISKDNNIRMLIECKCNRCGKTVLYPITEVEPLLGYGKDRANNPRIDEYYPADWHRFDAPLGLLCDECIQELMDTTPKKRVVSNYKPKDKNGLPLVFDRYYYCDGVSGVYSVIEIVGGCAVTIKGWDPVKH